MKYAERFTKARLVAELVDHRDGLAKHYGFDPKIGWVQVEGKETGIVVAYGKFDLLNDLIEEYAE